MNIADLFLAAAQKYPEQIALIEGDEKASYRELEQQVKSTAALFLAKGIRKGDRVLVFVPMSVDLYRIVLALFYIGATAVFLDEWVSKKRLALCCQIADCKAFIGRWKVHVLAFFTTEMRQIPIKLGAKRPTNTADAPPAEMQEDDPALITFTTGSTGTPKAANRTHGFLKAQFDALLDEIEPMPTDVDMPVLPIVLFVNLGVGCTSVIAEFNARKPEQLNPDAIVQQLQQHRVTRLTASPFFVKRLSQHLIQHPAAHTLGKVFTGGAPVFPSEAEIYQKAFPEAGIRIVYGSTEAEPISSVMAQELTASSAPVEAGLYVGKLYHQSQVRIIKMTSENIVVNNQQDLDDLTLTNGDVGEIIVAGPHVLANYFNNPEALRSNKVYCEDQVWHRTGDSGFLDPNGRLFLCGRCSQTIRKGGKLYGPFLYENLLGALDGISMGTILLLEDQLTLVVEAEKGADRKQLEQQLNDSNLNFDQIRWINRIPRDPRHNSKIDYGQLKAVL